MYYNEISKLLIKQILIKNSKFVTVTYVYNSLLLSPAIITN